MKNKVLIEILEGLDPEADVYVSVYQDNDSGEQESYVVDSVETYDMPKPNGHIQIKVG